MTEYKDRSTGLIVFGVLQILIGLFALVGCAFLALGLGIQRSAGTLPPNGLHSVGLAFVVYIIAAAFFITMGIGSIQACRWARALTLITAWLWLIGGTLSMALVAYIFPQMIRQIDAQASNPSPGLVNVILAVVFCFSALLYILLPLGFLLFYRSENVRLTCEFRHPQPSWTDRVPLPVLALCIMKAVGAVSLLAMAFLFPLLVFFGIVIHGMPAILLLLALAAVWTVLVYGLYRLRPGAYWASLGVLAFFWASTLVTMFRADWLRMYEISGTMNEQQLNLVRMNPLFQGQLFMWFILGTGVIYMGFVLYLRKFFVQQRAQPTPASL